MRHDELVGAVFEELGRTEHRDVILGFIRVVIGHEGGDGQGFGIVQREGGRCASLAGLEDWDGTENGDVPAWTTLWLLASDAYHRRTHRQTQS